jgi:hypothetical protein
LKNQPTCAVCGHWVGASAPIYMVSIQPKTQWLRIQHWDMHLAQEAGTRTVCQAAHVVELVALWMVTGSLDLEFVRISGVRPQVAQRQEPTGSRKLQSGSSQPGPFAVELRRNELSSGHVLEADADRLVKSLDALLSAMRESEGRMEVQPRRSRELRGKARGKAMEKEWEGARSNSNLSCAERPILPHPCGLFQ